ncbi:hypothetical protein AMTR_s00070p00139010, partial [Amborella trichopoda]
MVVHDPELVVLNPETVVHDPESVVHGKERGFRPCSQLSAQQGSALDHGAHDVLRLGKQPNWNSNSGRTMMVRQRHPWLAGMVHEGCVFGMPMPAGTCQGPTTPIMRHQGAQATPTVILA